MTSSYAQVPIDDSEGNDDIELTHISVSLSSRVRAALAEVDDDDDDDDDDDEDYGNVGYDTSSSKYGLGSRPSFDHLEEQLLWNVWNRWEEPCLLSIIITGFVLIPTLLLWIVGTYVFTGRFWAILIFSIHLQLRLVVSQWHIKSITVISFQNRRALRMACSIMTIVEILLCAVAYPFLVDIIIENFFRDVDMTIVTEWNGAVRYLRIIKFLGWAVALLRIPVAIGTVVVRGMKKVSSEYREWRPTFWTPNGQETMSDHARDRLNKAFQIATFLVLALNAVCLLSALSHFGPWPMVTMSQTCNPLDTTECALPFPSFHHMKPDETSKTGWRVHLQGLPPLRSGIPFHPEFLNELDGFSTMAPILFYMEGLKEAHEHNTNNRIELQGLERIMYSTTPESITLLFDVGSATLVPHSAEVDYLDQKNPLIMIIPAQPLKHATHYAVAVVNASDKDGRILPPTPGMQQLLKETNSEQCRRYMKKLFPALEKAAPWVDFSNNPLSVQLMFDFVTISEESQIGTLRATRDATLNVIQNWHWHQHVETVAVETQDCEAESTWIAKTIHVSFDCPSFLQNPNSRYSFLDKTAVKDGKPTAIAQMKAMIQIPCSVERATQGKEGGKLLKAIMEYGHGLFANRNEVRDEHLAKMANDQGYILVAMDWRGMSIFDIPIVIRTLIGNPSLFQAVRDNLIQGFANKLAFHHFIRHGDFLDWLEEEKRSPIHTWESKPPASIFYGISQGGILGAGYMSLSAKTNLIDRGILGVPGTPFALIMTRSLDFAGYDLLLLLNLYNNRHVRMLLSLMQMAWDTVEASGLLAPPVSEPIPRMLIYSGLGDPIVPSSASEALARATGAATLPGNPRTVFGVPQQPAANDTWIGPNVTLTEFLYEKEYSSLPLDNKVPPSNNVHVCIRSDEALILQVSEFANSGRVIDPCVHDQCRRSPC